MTGEMRECGEMCWRLQRAKVFLTIQQQVTHVLHKKSNLEAEHKLAVASLAQASRDHSVVRGRHGLQRGC